MNLLNIEKKGVQGMIGGEMSNIQFRLKSGNVTANLSGEAINMVNDLLDKVAPRSKQEMINYVEKIKEDARSKWLVRKENSKGSINKFYTRFYITSDLQIAAVVGNSAPYSYVIRVGPDSEDERGANSLIPTGKNLARETMIKPFTKNIDALVDILADEILKGLM